MRTGLSKKQKATNIYFNESDNMIEVCTYNTALKNRLTEFAGKYPSECRLIDDDGNGCLTFEVSNSAACYLSGFFLNVYFYLFGCTGSWLNHVGSSSLTRDQTWGPCIGSAES